MSSLTIHNLTCQCPRANVLNAPRISEIASVSAFQSVQNYAFLLEDFQDYFCVRYKCWK